MRKAECLKTCLAKKDLSLVYEWVMEFENEILQNLRKNFVLYIVERWMVTEKIETEAAEHKQLFLDAMKRQISEAIAAKEATQLMHTVENTINHLVAKIAEEQRRNKAEEEERRQKEAEEKEQAAEKARVEQEAAELAKWNKEEEVRLVAEKAEMEKAAQEAIRMEKEKEEEIRKAKEDAELAAVLLEEEEEAKAIDKKTRIDADATAAEKGLVDIPVEVTAEQAEETPVREGVVSLVPFIPTILRSEKLIFAPTTSSLVAELKGFMTQVAVTVQKNVNIVMKTLEERKEKVAFYDNSVETLFDLVQKGEEGRRKERGERFKLEAERLAREEKEREDRRKLDAERLAREAEEEVRRQEQFAKMLRIAMQGRTSSRSPASTSSHAPPPPPP